MLTQKDIVTLISVANEIFKRYEEQQTKTAQYESLAQELAPKIARKLVRKSLIDKEDEEQICTTLTKSASSAINMLYEVVDSITDVSKTDTTFGYPYSSNGFNPRNATDIKPEHLDGFVIDISRLR